MSFLKWREVTKKRLHKQQAFIQAFRNALSSWRPCTRHRSMRSTRHSYRQLKPGCPPAH